MYYYSVFGWNVASEFKLVELFEGSNKSEVDITIKEKSVTKDLDGAHKKGIGFQVKPGHYQLNIEGIARFYVIDGKEIWIDQEEGVDFKEVKVYLFASVLGGLCHLRGTLPIHASAVAHNGKSYLFAGNSGAGKSTLVAALQEKGFLALTDDLSPIMFERSKAILKQGIARIKLWPDALDWLNKEVNEKEKIRADLEKYAHAVEQNCEFGGSQVEKLFILSPNIYDRTLRIEEVKGKEKLVKLMRQTYRTQLIEGLGLKKQHFTMCAALSKQIKLYEIHQPRSKNSLHEQVDLIINHIHS